MGVLLVRFGDLKSYSSGDGDLHLETFGLVIPYPSKFVYLILGCSGLLGDELKVV